jgi:hypothetical protein
MDSRPRASEKGFEVLRIIVRRLVFSYGVVRWHWVRECVGAFVVRRKALPLVPREAGSRSNDVKTYGSVPRS